MVHRLDARASARIAIDQSQTTDQQVAFLIEPELRVGGETECGPAIGLAIARSNFREREGLRPRELVEREIRSILCGRPGGRARRVLAAALHAHGIDLDAEGVAELPWALEFDQTTAHDLETELHEGKPGVVEDAVYRQNRYRAT